MAWGPRPPERFKRAGAVVLGEPLPRPPGNKRARLAPVHPPHLGDHPAHRLVVLELGDDRLGLAEHGCEVVVQLHLVAPGLGVCEGRAAVVGERPV